MQAIYILLIALFISMVLIPPLKRVAGPLRLTDVPGGRKIHAASIPRTGGIAIAAGALIPLLLFVTSSHETTAFVVAAGTIFFFGLLDDRFNLNYKLKLLGQIIASLIITIEGGVLIKTLPFITFLELPAFIAIPLTVFVLTAITNAINLSDGLDGLAGGISILALGCIAAFAYQIADVFVFSVAIALMGATFGFLRFNSNPAQIFMGDSGSQFLGFCAGALAIMISQRPDSAIGTLVPFLVFGVPILDTLTVIVRRIAMGRPPFSPDRLHLHHQLLRATLSQPGAVSLVYIAQLVSVILAYLLRYSADEAILGAYIAFSIAVLWGLRCLSEYNGMIRDNARRPKTAVGTLIMMMHGIPSHLLVVLSHQALRTLLPALLVAGAVLATDVGLDITAMAVVLLIPTLALMLLPVRPSSVVERVALYATSVAILFLATPPVTALWGVGPLIVVFAVIGILTAVWIWMSNTTFETGSLDLLVLMIAFAAPFLSETLAQRFGIFLFQSIILFYAIEVLITESATRWEPLRIAGITSLAILAFKGSSMHWFH